MPIPTIQDIGASGSELGRLLNKYATQWWREGEKRAGVLAGPPSPEQKTALQDLVLGIAGGLRGSAAKEYRALMKEGYMPLYHSTPFPEEVLREGFDVRRSSSETYKPRGMFLAERIKNIPTHLSGEGSWPEIKSAFSRPLREFMSEKGEYGKSSIKYGKESDKIVRAIAGTDSKILRINEQRFEEMFDHWVEANSLQKYYLSGSFIRDKWTSHLRDRGYDAVILQNADKTPGLNEVIFMNPNKLSLFWENLSRPAEKEIETIKKLLQE